MCSGLSRMHEPSLSHNRPRFGCRLGTFSPSCLQIRSTRLWFTSQPSIRSRFVIWRYPYLPNRLANRITSVRSADSSTQAPSSPDAESSAADPVRDTRDVQHRPESLTYMHHAPASALGAQKFPLVASSRISLSTVRFATARFSRAFSFSSSLKRRA